MKSFICVLIWTIIFILFGIYVNKGISDFTYLYKDKIIVIENNIENDNWYEAKIQITKLKNSWFEKKDIWYKLLNHTYLYKDKIIVIENNIENDNWYEAKIQITKLKNSWFEKKDIWYKLLNHESFDEISLHINILDKCINIKDKSKSLENIEIIKITLENILENETYDMQHIL